MINIVQNRKISFIISGILFLTSVVLVATLGLKLGIDFTGGSLMEVSFSGVRPEVEDMRDILDPLDYGNITIQPANDDSYILKLRFISEEEHQVLLNTIRTAFEIDVEGELTGLETEEMLIEGGMVDGDGSDYSEEVGPGGAGMEDSVVVNKVYEKRIETIGSSISSHLRNKVWYTAFAVIFAIIFYVAYAFRKVSKPVKSWKFGITAIIALIHDVAIVMGLFALLGHYKGIEINVPFVVALLTILGYSVNDTIVVFDRVRENIIKYGYDKFEYIVNKGVNETLVRSLNTSVTTLVVLSALFLFGGETIRYFSLALIVGIISGTYSSIFLASPLLVVWERLGRRK